MRKLLFVVTTGSNMGDLSLCQAWIADLGRRRYRYGFVLSPRLAPFLDPRDERFFFAPAVHVRETILAAVDHFAADAVVVACNGFWNLPGQEGATFGSFPLEPHDLGVPVLSFDPFEIGFDLRLPGSAEPKRFAAVPHWVWALRYMSLEPTSPNARHFRARRAYAAARRRPRAETLARHGGDPDRRSLVYAVSRNRFDYIQEHFPGYYRHLGGLLSRPPLDRAQVFLLMPRPLPELAGLAHVRHVPFVPYEEFLALVGAADLYLADSLLSCIVDAFHLGTPALLLANSEASRGLEAGSFLAGRFFPYRVFPYGMCEISDALEGRFEIAGCYEVAEVLNETEVVGRAAALLFDDERRAALKRNCRRWRRQRSALPEPRAVVEEILTVPRTNRSDERGHDEQQR